jgi:hypothetical protein
VEDKPLRISWSRLRAHSECPAKGQLLATGHKAKGADIRNYFHGTVVDSCMRQWLKQDKPEPGWMLGHLEAVLAAEEEKAKATGDGVVRWRSLDDRREVTEFCRELLMRLERLLDVICLPYGWQPAPRFTLPLTIPGLDGQPRSIELTGEIDLLTQTPQGIFVWDLKATKDGNYWRKVQAQLVFYELAVFIMKGEWPHRSALIQPMCERQVMPFSFTDQDHTDMSVRIVRVAHDIWKGNLFPKADSAGCQSCPVRHACPKYRTPGGRGRVALPGSVPVASAGGAA